MTRYPLYFEPGDDESRVFKYLDSDGAVIPLTGYTAVWTGTVGNTTVNVSGVIDGVLGKVTVNVSDANTTALGAAGSIGEYKLKVTSSGGIDTTIASGPLVIFN